MHWTHFQWSYLKMAKMTIFRYVGNDLNVPLAVSSMHQTIKGDPRVGWDELEPNRPYLSHFHGGPETCHWSESLSYSFNLAILQISLFIFLVLLNPYHMMKHNIQCSRTPWHEVTTPWRRAKNWWRGDALCVSAKTRFQTSRAAFPPCVGASGPFLAVRA